MQIFSITNTNTNIWTISNIYKLIPVLVDDQYNGIKREKVIHKSDNMIEKMNSKCCSISSYDIIEEIDIVLKGDSTVCCNTKSLAFSYASSVHYS